MSVSPDNDRRALVPWARRLLYTAFALSGAANLVFEVVWFRVLGVEEGRVTGAAAVVTGTYMAGLALGNFLGGRLAERVRRRVLAYALVEWSVALVSPAVLWGLEALSGQSASAAGWALAVAVLAAPTVAMGMALPLVVCALGTDRRHAGRCVSYLYGLNTAGAMLGSLWAGFVGVPAWGVARSAEMAMALQGLAGLLAVLVVRQVMLISVPRRAETVRLRVVAHAPGVLGLAFAASGAAMFVQVTWTALGSSWARAGGGPFAVTVCVYLLGLSLGAFGVSRFLEVWEPRRLLGRILVGIAAALGLALAVGLWASTAGRAVPFGLVTLSLLPATMGMGMVFPVFVRTVSQAVRARTGGAAVGPSVGTTSAASTVGAVLGSLGGAALVPTLGVASSLLGALVLYVCLGELARRGARAHG